MHDVTDLTQDDDFYLQYEGEKVVEAIRAHRNITRRGEEVYEGFGSIEEAVAEAESTERAGTKYNVLDCNCRVVKSGVVPAKE